MATKNWKRSSDSCAFFFKLTTIVLKTTRLAMINWRALSSWGEFEVQSGCLWTEVLFFCVFVCEDMNILRMGIISDFRVFFPLSAVGWWINITLRKQQDLISLFVVKDDRRQRWVKRRFSQEILLLTWFLFVRSIT